MPNKRNKTDEVPTWSRSEGDKSLYRGYQARYSGGKILKLPKGGSVVSRVATGKKEGELLHVEKTLE